MESILTLVKERNVDLSEGQIEGILHLLLTNKVSSMSDLVQVTGITKSVILAFKKSIADFLQEGTEGICLNELGLQVLSQLNPRAYSWSLYTYEDKQKEETLQALRKKYFFDPKREFDQFFALAETSIKKVNIVNQKGGIKGKRIAIFGDDDLLSLAIPLLATDYAELVVFDIDPQLLARVSTAVGEQGFERIKTVLYDARNEPPKQYMNYFDVVITDPPYTKSGFDLFLDRCVQFSKVKKDYSGSYIFIYYGIGVKNLEREVKLLESIHLRNLYLEDKIFKFARYTGAETVGNASNLYILKTTPHTALIQEAFTKDIYTFENVKEEKFPYVDHYVFKLFGVSAELLKSKSKLLKVCGDFCNKHKLKVVDTKVTQFKPFGFSLTYILASSNLVIHTWEEYGGVHIDLVTCSPIYNASTLSSSLISLFGARNVEYYKVE